MDRTKKLTSAGVGPEAVQQLAGRPNKTKRLEFSQGLVYGQEAPYKHETG